MTNENLVQRLKEGQNSAFVELYKSGFPLIYKLVTSNNGTKRDAQDLMQDTIFALVKNLRKPNFKLTCQINTYLYSIARNLWMMKLRGSGKELLSIDDGNQQFVVVDENDISFKEEVEAKYKLLASVMTEMGEKCRKIIMEFYYKKTSLEEIAKIVGLTAQSVKVTKHRCMKDFKSKVASKNILEFS